MKCQYHGCCQEASKTAIGGDWYGNEHVYNVCLQHAAEMEPREFGEEWAEANKLATTQQN